MITINTAKDDLAKQLFPTTIEEQYIRLTRELINYVKLNKKKKSALNKIKTTNDDTIKNLCALECKALITKIDMLLGKILNILKEIMDNYSLDHTQNATIVPNQEYSEEEIDLIQSYVNMRKSVYKFIEYIGYVLIKKEDLNQMDSIAFMLSLKALKIFNLDLILLSRKNLKEIAKLMDLTNRFITNKEIDLNTLREVNSLSKDPDYLAIIDILNNNYVKTISPNSK